MAMWIGLSATQDCCRQKCEIRTRLVAIVQFTPPRQTRHRQDRLVVSGGRCELDVTEAARRLPIYSCTNPHSGQYNMTPHSHRMSILQYYFCSDSPFSTCLFYYCLHFVDKSRRSQTQPPYGIHGTRPSNFGDRGEQSIFGPLQLFLSGCHFLLGSVGGL